MKRKKNRSCYTKRKKSLLPQELVMEILSWLPAKSLLRFRCVCKNWNQLLRDPYFIQLHLLLHQSIKPNNNHHLNSDKQFLFLSGGFGHTGFHCALNYNACHKAMKLYSRSKCYYEVVGICNGLMCLANSGIDRNPSEVYVWNPLIRDHIIIPCTCSLPHLYYTRFGFGFLQSTNDYKLIRIASTRDFKCSESEYCSHVSVYTLGSTDSWRTLEPIFYRLLHKNPGTFVNEALHWLAARQNESFSTWNSIISFDLKDEVFHEIPQPNGFKDYHCSNSPYVELGELNGLLCMFRIHPDEDVQIWVMKEYGVVDSWTKQFKIGRLMVRDCSYSLQPLGLANNGEIILRKDNWQLILYNPKTNSSTSLKKLVISFNQVYAFVGSFVSPSSFNSGHATC